ncbi:MAG: hypothetical protein AB1750_02840, partial [Chloroflexota bacterium]
MARRAHCFRETRVETATRCEVRTKRFVGVEVGALLSEVQFGQPGNNLIHGGTQAEFLRGGRA